jgi:hypothetical protein
MSFTYRPTPILTLGGKTVGSDGVPLQRLPAGTMHGYTPNMASPALNAIGRRTLRGDPWLLRSGTMRGFLGQDDDDSGLIETTMAPDTGTLMEPTLPPIVLAPSADQLNLSTTMAPSGSLVTAPAVNLNTYGASLLSPGDITAAEAQTTAQTSAAQAAAKSAAAAAPSLLTSIANLFKPSTAVTPMTAAQPGVYSALTTTPSWFNQSTLVAGTPNSTVLIFGVAALVALAVVAGGKK